MQHWLAATPCISGRISLSAHGRSQAVVAAVKGRTLIPEIWQVAACPAHECCPSVALQKAIESLTAAIASMRAQLSHPGLAGT